jgi:hypothetical protein
MASSEGGHWAHRVGRLLKIVLGVRPGRLSEGMAVPWTASREVLQVKVALLDIEPTIWRRLLIPAHHTLADLHDAIQVAFGWEGWHGHVFTVRGREYGSQDPVEVAGARDETILLAKLDLRPGTSIRYVHDFGDNWIHEILVEKVMVPEEPSMAPVCLEGRRAGPPDDCGGPLGYKHLLKALRNRKHPEHRDLKDWVGSDWRPEAFHLDEVNAKLRDHFAPAKPSSIQKVEPSDLHPIG